MGHTSFGLLQNILAGGATKFTTDTEVIFANRLEINHSVTGQSPVHVSIPLSKL